jgi:hypothetical protein
MMYVFMEEYDPAQKLIQKEGKDMAWKTPQEAKKLKMIKHDREVFAQIVGKY